MLPTYRKIVTCIVQPRDIYGEQVKICEFTPQSLQAWMNETVLPAIDSALSDEPLYSATEKACRWCDFSGECPEQTKTAIGISQGCIEPLPLEECLTRKNPILADALGDEELALALEYSKMIRDWSRAVENKALERMMRGTELHDFKIVERSTQKAWNPHKDVDHILYKELKIKKKDLYKQTLKTPNQILEMLQNDKLKAKRVEDLIIKPKGDPVVVPISDRRKVMADIPNAENDFKDV